MPLRKADVTSTRKFEDGDAWIVLRVELAKGEADALKDLTAKYQLNPNADDILVEIRNCVAEANQALFEILCDSWSLGDVSGESYAGLDEESGEWVDGCIAEVLKARRERAVKNAPSSKRRSGRATSSAKPAASK